MDRHASNALNGTKTMQNLKDASKNEALAYTKYTIYSDIASRDGYEDVADMFSRFAGNEKEHAELWLGYLNELGDTQTNLDTAMYNENYENSEYYPELSRIAKEEGFPEIAEKFRMVGTVEASHAKKLSKASESFADGSMFEGDADTKWVCMNCGYETSGNVPPERCPLCGYPKGYFKKIN